MEEKLELRDVLAMLRQRWLYIAAIVATGVACALLYLSIVTPRYTSEALLRFDPGQFLVSSDNSSVSNELFDRTISGEIAQITSAEILWRTIDALELRGDSELTAPGAMAEIRNAFSGLLGNAPAATSQDAGLLERFRQQLSVYQPDRTNLITIEYTSQDPEKAAAVANELAGVFLAAFLDDQLENNPVASTWLNERRAALLAQWRQSEELVEEYKASHDISFAGEQNITEQQIVQLNEQLVRANAASGEAAARLEQIRRLLDSQAYDQLAQIVHSDLMTRLRELKSVASQRFNALETSLLPSHPRLQQARSQVTSLNADIAAEAERVMRDLELQRDTTGQSEALAQSSLDRTIGALRNNSADLVKLRELERNAAADRAIYEAFLNRSNESIERLTGQLANYTLIQRAEVPSRPSYPSKPKILAITLIVSTAAAIGLALLLGSMASDLRTGRDVTQHLNVPHLASLPRVSLAHTRFSRSSRPVDRFVSERPDSAFAEAIGSIFASLHLGSHRNPTVLAVTSTFDDEGKTTVAANLAQYAARRDVKTLLIDANYGAPALHIELGGPAISDSGDSFDDTGNGLIVWDSVAGVDIMRLPAPERRLPDFIDSDEHRTLLAKARERYDLVIIDTGSLASCLESWLLAGQADLTLITAKSAETDRDHVAHAVRSLRDRGVSIAGVVLNFATRAENGVSRMIPPNTVMARPAGANGTVTARISRLHDVQPDRGHFVDAVVAPAARGAA